MATTGLLGCPELDYFVHRGDGDEWTIRNLEKDEKKTRKERIEEMTKQNNVESHGRWGVWLRG